MKKVGWLAGWLAGWLVVVVLPINGPYLRLQLIKVAVIICVFSVIRPGDNQRLPMSVLNAAEV